MIYQSPYETTIGKVLNIKGVEEKIRTALAQNYPWIKVDENNRTILITQMTLSLNLTIL